MPQMLFKTINTTLINNTNPSDTKPWSVNKLYRGGQKMCTHFKQGEKTSITIVNFNWLNTGGAKTNVYTF